MISHWLQYRDRRQTQFGTFCAATNTIQPYTGDMFQSPQPKGEPIQLDQVKLCTPSAPSKVIALWNNYRALAELKELSHPQTPLYLIKPPNTYLAGNQAIQHPQHYDGKIFYEGELGIVIGQTAKDIKTKEQGEQYIFGYTCINDVTAFDLLKDDQNFDQWTRAKGFDGFGVMGPVIATSLDFNTLEIQTKVNNEVKQHYSASDMIMPPGEIVQRLSQNMTLLPGDVICCGTSVGLGPMPRGCEVSVSINGIGTLTNRYE